MGECLHRYIPTDTYHARIRRKDKELRRSPETTDRATGDRKPSDLHKEVERTGAGTARVTLTALCDRYIETIQDQKAKILKRQRHIAV